jgi:hypothetical protein
MFEWLEATSLAVWVKESWGWPLALTIHAFGSALMVGFSFIMLLRLIGLFRTIPAGSLQKLIPIIWTCLVLQAASGGLLWLTKPARYLSDGLFDVKMFFVILGFFMTMQFQKTIRAEAGGWESSGTISKRGLQFVALTAFAWAGVLVMGRLTAYLGQLYHVS